MHYDPRNWYWSVAGRDDFYSSASAAFVEDGDEGLATWRDAGGEPTRIASEAELGEVLYLAGVPAPALPYLPETVPMYRVKKYMALVKAQSGGATDLHAQVMAYIDALPEPNRTLARIDFGPDAEQIGSPNLVVNSPLALGAKAALGLTDEQYADMIAAANALA